MTVRYGNDYVKPQRVASQHYIRPIYLLAACMDHVNIAPRPQSKVASWRVTVVVVLGPSLRKHKRSHKMPRRHKAGSSVIGWSHTTWPLDSQSATRTYRAVINFTYRPVSKFEFVQYFDKISAILNVDVSENGCNIFNFVMKVFPLSNPTK